MLIKDFINNNLNNTRFLDFPHKKEDFWRHSKLDFLNKEIESTSLKECNTVFKLNTGVNHLDYGPTQKFTNDKFELFVLENSKNCKSFFLEKDCEITYNIKDYFSNSIIKFIIPLDKKIKVNLDIENSPESLLNINHITFKIYGELELEITGNNNINNSIISYLNLIINKGAKVTLNITENGSELNKRFINTIQHESSVFIFSYRSLIKSKENNDLVINSVIKEPNCILTHDIKVVLFDESKFSCYGIIDIENNGGGSEADHKQSTIAMSNDVGINATPILKIHNGNVKCSHGAPSYYIKDSDRFYMLSRGLTRNQCDRLLLSSFLGKNQKINQLLGDLYEE